MKSTNVKKFVIPECFTNEKYGYLGNSILLKFCRKNDMKVDIPNKDTLLEAISTFGFENQEIIKNWTEKVLREGIKHIYISKVNITEDITILLNDSNNIIDYISSIFNISKNTYIVDYRHSNVFDYNLLSYRYDSKKLIVFLTYCFTLFHKDKYNNITKIIYPVFIDIDLENNLIYGRAKSISSLYTYSKNEIYDDENKIDTKKIILETMSKVLEKLNITSLKSNELRTIFKNNLFKILDDFTFTPESIKTKIQLCKNPIIAFIDQTFKMCNIQVNSKQNAIHDLEIFLEKHISINEKDKSIFTKDREAYPIKIGVTSLDSVKVEESTSKDDPLQHTEAYYDNKKSTIFKKMCDRLSLCFKRRETIYFGSSPFVVKMSVMPAGYCFFSFPEYVEEEDIQNVLSYFVKDNR